MPPRPYMIDKYCCYLLPAFRYGLGSPRVTDMTLGAVIRLKNSSATTFVHMRAEVRVDGHRPSCR
jgi:hypothetical protein